MAPASAGVLSALRKARDVKVKEINALASVAEKLYAAIENVEKSLSGQIEKTVAKPLISKLHSFLIQAACLADGQHPPSPPPSPLSNDLVPQSQKHLPERSATVQDPQSSPSHQGSRTYAQALKDQQTMNPNPQTDRIDTTGASKTAAPTIQRRQAEAPSRRSFLRVDRDHPDWQLATPAGIMTLLVEKIGFPRVDISRVYPVKSGFCIELSKSSLRDQLAQKAAAHGFCIEPETVTYAYLLSNVPKTIKAYDGSDRPTEPLIAEEVEVTIKQKAQVHRLNTPGSYLVILKHKVLHSRCLDPTQPNSSPADPVSILAPSALDFITSTSVGITQSAENAVANSGITGNTN